MEGGGGEGGRQERNAATGCFDDRGRGRRGKRKDPGPSSEQSKSTLALSGISGTAKKARDKISVREDKLQT